MRDVDPQYISEIDKKCKVMSERSGRNYSRNDYLKQLIRTDSEIDLIDYRKSEFDIAIDEMKLAFKSNEESIKGLTDTYKMLFDYLIKNIE